MLFRCYFGRISCLLNGYINAPMMVELAYLNLDLIIVNQYDDLIEWFWVN